MKTNENILGCFASTTIGDEKGILFRRYIWGETGICEILKKLKHQRYGKDLTMILFQFYVNPIPYLLQKLKEIEDYRKTEKAIGIPIIINEDNFFSKSEQDRYQFIKKSILSKIALLATVVKRNGLDTNIELLNDDIAKILI